MTDFEMVEAERFAQALDAIEALAEPDLDPREDPTLFSLAALAAELYDTEQAATRSPRFESYRERSRTYVLNRLGARRAAQQVDDSAPREEAKPFFIFRWNVLTPIFSAAATAVLVLAFVAATQLDSTPAQTAAVVEPPAAEQAGPQVAVPEPREADTQKAVPADAPAPDNTSFEVPAPGGVARSPESSDPDYVAIIEGIENGPTTVGPYVPPPTDLGPVVPGQEEQYAARMLELEIERIGTLIAAIAFNVDNDQPVDPAMLRDITESSALVAEQLEAQPELVSKQQVISFLTSTAHGRTLLAAARADEENGRALGAARRAAQDGVVVASHYIREHY
ncbi:MAG: hypothetical protein F4056_00405 [Chloroflexi bacterium]|nr:hypothetical protein [Chloroflexota bacterium]